MKDHSERKAYRRSPGRQYGYDYDPLRIHRGLSQQGRGETSNPGDEWSDETSSRDSNHSELQLAPRPNLRRTRQLLRQSILASKTHTTLEDEDSEQQPSIDDDQNRYDEQTDSTLFSNRYQARRNRPVQSHSPTPQRAVEPEQEQEEWADYDAFVDPDIGYENPLDQRVGHSQALPIKTPAYPPVGRRAGVSQIPTRVPSRRLTRNAPPDYDDADYDYEDEYDQPAPRRRKKGGITRRGILWGIGAAAVGGTALAAYELAPRLPKAIGDVGSNIEHQLQDAFNKGVTAGANEVRKELINELENLEGVSLDAAITAAKLTRVAYDTFVSPLVTLAATVTGDFLNITLRALIQGRHWLSNIGQDNSMLQALQTVLETWVKQVTNMPKQIQAITDTDLDGAQAYLRALQQKIKDEQAKLNGQAPTPNPTSTPKH